jgi:hypothetical protein
MSGRTGCICSRKGSRREDPFVQIQERICLMRVQDDDLFSRAQRSERCKPNQHRKTQGHPRDRVMNEAG